MSLSKEIECIEIDSNSDGGEEEEKEGGAEVSKATVAMTVDINEDDVVILDEGKDKDLVMEEGGILGDEVILIEAGGIEDKKKLEEAQAGGSGVELEEIMTSSEEEGGFGETINVTTQGEKCKSLEVTMNDGDGEQENNIEEGKDSTTGGNEMEVDDGEENVKENVGAAVEAIIAMVAMTVDVNEDTEAVIMGKEKEQALVLDEGVINEVMVIDMRRVDEKGGSVVELEEVVTVNEEDKKAKDGGNGETNLTNLCEGITLEVTMNGEMQEYNVEEGKDLIAGGNENEVSDGEVDAAVEAMIAMVSMTVDINEDTDAVIMGEEKEQPLVLDEDGIHGDAVIVMEVGRVEDKEVLVEESDSVEQDKVMTVSEEDDDNMTEIEGGHGQIKFTSLGRECKTLEILMSDGNGAQEDNIGEGKDLIAGGREDEDKLEKEGVIVVEQEDRMIVNEKDNKITEKEGEKAQTNLTTLGDECKSLDVIMHDGEQEDNVEEGKNLGAGGREDKEELKEEEVAFVAEQEDRMTVSEEDNKMVEEEGRNEEKNLTTLGEECKSLEVAMTDGEQEANIEEAKDLIAGGKEKTVDDGEVGAAVEAIIAMVAMTVDINEDTDAVIMSEEKEKEQALVTEDGEVYWDAQDSSLTEDKDLPVVIINARSDSGNGEDESEMMENNYTSMENDLVNGTNGRKEDSENEGMNVTDILEEGHGKHQNDLESLMDEDSLECLLCQKKFTTLPTIRHHVTKFHRKPIANWGLYVYSTSQISIEDERQLMSKDTEMDTYANENNEMIAIVRYGSEQEEDSDIEIVAPGRKRKRNESQSLKPSTKSFGTQMSPKEKESYEYSTNKNGQDEKCQSERVGKRRKLEILSKSQSWVSVSVQVSNGELSGAGVDDRSWEETTFKCPYCPQTFFEGAVGLIQHLAEHNHFGQVQEKDATGDGSKTTPSTEDENAKKWRCSDCTFACNDISKFMDHVSTHITKNKQHRCTDCSSIFNDNIQLKNHVNEAHSKKDDEQDQISVQDPTSVVGLTSSGTTHDLTPTPQTPSYQCTECTSSFRRAFQLAKHVNEAHPKKDDKQDQISVSGPPSVVGLTSSVPIHDLTPIPQASPYQCTECNSSFKRVTQLTKHVSKAHPKTDAPDTPKRVEVSSTARTINLTSIPNAKSYNCTECNSNFQYAIQLKNHIKKAHPKNDGAPDPVPDADTSTGMEISSSGRIVGLTSIPNTKPYNCTECDSSFKYSNQLAKHVNKAHPKNDGAPDPVPDADISTGMEISSSGRIIGLTSNAEPHNCTECDSSFKFGIQLKNHIKKAHPKNNGASHSVVDLTSNDSIPIPETPLYKCSECNSSFKNALKLTKHINRAHPRSCDDGDQDVMPQPLKVVELSSTDSPDRETNHPYKCPECSSSFKRSIQLTKHVSETHYKTHVQVSDQPVVVLEPMEIFNSDSTPTAKNYPYKCTECSSSFKYIIQLTKHVNRAHPKDPEPQPSAVVELSSGESDIFEQVSVTSAAKTFKKRKTDFSKKNGHTQSPQEIRAFDKSKTPNNMDKEAQVLEETPETCKTKDDDKHSCKICGRVFLGVYFLEQHKCSQSKSSSARCSPCNKTFSSVFSLKRHEMKVHGNDGNKKDEEDTLVKPDDLNNSETVTINALPVKLKPCKVVMTRCDNTIPKKRKRSSSESSAASEETKSHKTNSNEKEKQMMQIPVKDNLKKSALIQMQKRFGKTRYKCTQCNKTFTSKENAVEHTVVHSQNEVASPEHEQKSKQNNKQTASEIHSNLYTCHVCSKEFNQFYSLQQHILTHGEHPDKKSHKCNKCPKAFSTASKLRGHLAGAHPSPKKKKR